MDPSVIWSAVGALGTLAAAGVAAWAAKQSREAAQQANKATDALAEIENDRRHGELTPRFTITVVPLSPGSGEVLRLRIMLAGPPGLDRLDGLTVRIRDDHFRRGEGQMLAAGPTREQIEEQIWGPYMFRAGTGPDQSRADPTGRVPYGYRGVAQPARELDAAVRVPARRSVVLARHDPVTGGEASVCSGNY
jgi:hypothetical protein